MITKILFREESVTLGERQGAEGMTGWGRWRAAVVGWTSLLAIPFGLAGESP